MANKTLIKAFEALTENKSEEAAKLLHSFFVENARALNNKMLAEEALNEEFNDNLEDDFMDDVGEEGSDDLDKDMEDIESEMTEDEKKFDFGDEDEDEDEEKEDDELEFDDEDKEEKIDDLADELKDLDAELEALKAEFDAILGDKDEDELESGDDFELEDDEFEEVEDDDDSDFDMEDDDFDLEDEERLGESVELSKVAEPSKTEGSGVSKRSPLNPKKGMEGTHAKPVRFSEGDEKQPAVRKKTYDQDKQGSSSKYGSTVDMSNTMSSAKNMLKKHGESVSNPPHGQDDPSCDDDVRPRLKPRQG